MKEANSKLSLHAYYLQKVMVALLAFAMSIGFQFIIHENIKHHILHPNENITTGGNQSSGQLELSKERYAFENSLVGEMIAKDIPPDQLVSFVGSKTSGKNFIAVGEDENAYAAAIIAEEWIDKIGNITNGMSCLLLFL